MVTLSHCNLQFIKFQVLHRVLQFFAMSWKIDTDIPQPHLDKIPLGPCYGRVGSHSDHGLVTVGSCLIVAAGYCPTTELYMTSHQVQCIQRSPSPCPGRLTRILFLVMLDLTMVWSRWDLVSLWLEDGARKVQAFCLDFGHAPEPCMAARRIGQALSSVVDVSSGIAAINCYSFYEAFWSIVESVSTRPDSTARRALKWFAEDW